MTRLKMLRLRAGLTQREMADKAGVKIRVYQSYEQGQRPIEHVRTETVLRMAKALECRVEDLIETQG